MVRLEWAVTRALHAPDVDPLDARRLAGLDQADHERVRFVAHPSLSLLRAEYPVDTIWRAVLAEDDAALGAIDLAAGACWLLVERSATGVENTRLDESRWRVADALIAGLPLGTALEIAPDTEASSLLAEHIVSGRFVAFNLARPATQTTVRENAS